MPAVEQDLTQGSVTRKLVRYALPLVASSLLQAIYSITDIIIAGHYIGDVGISAINNASIIMNMLTQLAIGLTVGGNVLVGQYFGSGDHENRRKAAGNMLTVGLIAGLLFAVGILLLGRPLLILLQSPTLEEATAYLSICGVGLLFIFVYNSLSAILRGVGNSRIPLYCIIASVSLNVVLDILFVAGFHMGVAGAALATVIGQAISCLTALVFSLRHRADLGLLPRYLRPEAEMVKRTLKLGFPSPPVDHRLHLLAGGAHPHQQVRRHRLRRQRRVQQNPRLLPALPLRPDHWRGHHVRPVPGSGPL